MNNKAPVIAAIITICAALGLSVVVTQKPTIPAPLRSEVPAQTDASSSDLTVTPSTQALFRIGPSDIYPNPVVTPGATNPDVTQDTISQNICNPQWSTKSIRPAASYTTALKVKQLAGDYAYENISDTKLVEEDHLISLELGGSPDSPLNLWPEPYTTSIPDGGAKVKDTVENYLHKQVCSGAITLADAQRLISSDWYMVYKNMLPSVNKVGAAQVIGIDQNDQ